MGSEMIEIVAGLAVVFLLPLCILLWAFWSTPRTAPKELTDMIVERMRQNGLEATDEQVEEIAQIMQRATERAK